MQPPIFGSPIPAINCHSKIIIFFLRFSHITVPTRSTNANKKINQAYSNNRERVKCFLCILLYCILVGVCWKYVFLRLSLLACVGNTNLSHILYVVVCYACWKHVFDNRATGSLFVSGLHIYLDHYMFGLFLFIIKFCKSLKCLLT